MKLTLRKATLADSNFLLQLKNDPTSLRWSWNHEPVSPDAHRKWLEKALFNNDPQIYIAMVGKRLVGTIRVKLDSELNHEISFTVIPEERGKGYGTKMLLQLPREEGVKLTAYIDPGNMASLRAFEKAGFKLLWRAVKA